MLFPVHLRLDHATSNFVVTTPDKHSPGLLVAGGDGQWGSDTGEGGGAPTSREAPGRHLEPSAKAVAQACAITESDIGNGDRRDDALPYPHCLVAVWLPRVDDKITSPTRRAPLAFCDCL